MKTWVLFVSLVALWSPARCYYFYQTVLPNGQQVPHPCKPNFIWHGVGHLSPLGGGDRNPFGEDFARLGHTWNQELCRLDSDHDGLTNGQELGDPDCVWSQGQIPARTDNITHPGVCDPWGSPRCSHANTWVTCDVGQFQCDAINEPHVQNITLRFPRTKVPAKETTYECMVFDIPAEETYHLIAFTPYIDNPNVMHHIGIFACDGSTPAQAAPEECNMAALGCTFAIGVWTLGMTGDCVHPDAGFRIGKGSASRIALQFHWTNKHLVDSWYDASGVTLYYTPRLRPYDAGVMINGQMDLNIPAGLPSVTAVGSCSSACSQRIFNGSVNIISGLNHMHYLGIRGKIEQIRNGHVIKNITNDDPYGYDSPTLWKYPDPVVMQPGDELRMTCEFSSLSRDRTTYYGPGSYDEMCFGIMTYYPAANYLSRSACAQWRDLDICDLDDKGCKSQEFLNSSSAITQAVLTKVTGACRYGVCTAECPGAIAEAKQLSPCLQGQMWEFLKSSTVDRNPHADPKIMQLILLMDSCDHQADQSEIPVVASASHGQENGGQPTSTTEAPTATEHSGCQHQMGEQPASGSSQRADSASTFLKLAKELGSRPLFQNIIFNA